jgi:two-component system chemotaxis response regulator CheB
MERKVRVLVVDDSALMRKKVSDMINADESCEVVATARNGEEAVRAVAALKPDVVTMDVELPRMNGVTALRHIMKENPTPVVMLSALTQEGAVSTLRSLEYGAVDFLAKPSGVISLDIEKVRNELIAKIKTAADANLGALSPLRIEDSSAKEKVTATLSDKVVVIASSTGGPRALTEILPSLEARIEAGVLVVQHIPEGFSRPMAERLNAVSKIRVKEAEDGEPVRQGEAFIAPAGCQMAVVREGERGIVKIMKERRTNGLSPSADTTLKSIAPLYRENSLGVILTGMGNDGTEGLRVLKEFGGSSLAEDRKTSVVYGMPKAAWEAGVVDKVVPLPEIAQEIMRWAKQRNKDG